MSKTPAYILGASGFAAGELLRLLHGHPEIEPSRVVSASSPGKPIGELHPHLAAAYPDLLTTSIEECLAGQPPGERVAIFSALPHGFSAATVDDLVSSLNGTDMYVVDMSADFRFEDQFTFEKIYGLPHPAPGRIPDYVCSIPEHSDHTDPRFVAHPGCFTTSVIIPVVPLIKTGHIKHVMVSSVTGSTGSGRDPKPTTHHPVRANNLYSYKPLAHRHTREMEILSGRAGGGQLSVSFVPHSGPFARGIHSTIFARNDNNISTGDLLELLNSYYDSSPFIFVTNSPPRLKDVVGTNNCHISAQADDTTIVLFSVIDNLVKGASGGAIQWMNRMLGIPEETGLKHPGLGWL
ncbi:MAG: N-acetyl-gamma-glutamyl-phosphate reductase [Rhodothermales bacterium]|nr:N-acetyl-gamma-glutamyl-phosphate reductase [Rhodothermales bacterium]